MNEPKRAWHRRKRWWAAGAVLAVAGYFACLGPLAYGEARGWIGKGAAERRRLPATLYSRYVGWWQLRGWADRGTGPLRRPRPFGYGTPIHMPLQGGLPPVMPDPDAPASPVDPADLPPPPAP